MRVHHVHLHFAFICPACSCNLFTHNRRTKKHLQGPLCGQGKHCLCPSHPCSFSSLQLRSLVHTGVLKVTAQENAAQRSCRPASAPHPSCAPSQPQPCPHASASRHGAAPGPQSSAATAAATAAPAASTSRPPRTVSHLCR